VVTKVVERWAVNEQAAQKFDGKGFNLRNLNEQEFGNSTRLSLQTGLQLWGP